MVENIGFLNEIPYLKNGILEQLLCDPYLMKLVSDDPDIQVPALSMRCDRVYPWEYTLGTTQDARAYITMEMVGEPIQDYETRTYHPALKNVHLYVYVFCHQSIMMIDDAAGARLGIDQRGTRIDLMSARIDELLNGKELSSFGYLGFAGQEIIEPVAQNYPGKMNTYTTLQSNRWGSRL